jgi:hypothetical protein
MVRISNSVYVSLAQRYWNENWSPEENRLVYGNEASSEGLGSNMRVVPELEVAEQATETPLNEALARVKDLLDHKCLFVPGGALAARPSTLENIALFLAENLFQEPAAANRWHALTVWETDHLACTVYPRRREDVVLHMRVRNLHLSLRGGVEAASGLLIERAKVATAVETAFAAFAGPFAGGREAWAPALFEELRKSLEVLVELRIDLGRHETLVVGTGA